MGTNIITGYTGTRHITPAMDAMVHRSAFGAGNYILSDGNRLEGSMPSINEFSILDGIVSMQGHQIQILQETLSVDTCATGYLRIDLVCVRYTHDNESLIDGAELVVIKGAEVQSGNTPVTPAYNEGVIDAGATVVDMPLYKISLSGATVTFERVAETVQATIHGLAVLALNVATISSLPMTITDDRIEDDMVVLKADLGTPSAQTGDWTVTTSAGSLTISGSISGSTTATLYLQHSR